MTQNFSTTIIDTRINDINVNGTDLRTGEGKFENDQNKFAYQLILWLNIFENSNDDRSLQHVLSNQTLKI